MGFGLWDLGSVVLRQQPICGLCKKIKKVSESEWVGGSVKLHWLFGFGECCYCYVDFGHLGVILC